MNELTIVIPALSTPWELVDSKLITLATALEAKLDIVIHADSPSLKRSYFFGDSAIIDAAQRFRDSVEQWCDELMLKLSAAGLESHTEIFWGRDIEDHFEPRDQCREGMLVLISSAAHISQEYCNIIRHIDIPILLLRDKAWGASLSVMVAVDPVHEKDLPRARDFQLVQAARALSETLAGSLMVVHSCFVPPYLLSAKKEIIFHHRANFRDFMEENRFGRLPSMMISGDPSWSLREYANDNQIDILAIGSVSRGFLDRLIIGSTTENILSNTPCDLLLVRD